jgi:hypothetical protein
MSDETNQVAGETGEDDAIAAEAAEAAEAAGAGETAPTARPVRRVIIELPDVKSDGYAATSFGISLNGEQARTLANVMEALQAKGEPITSAAGAIGWLLDQIAAA